MTTKWSTSILKFNVRKGHTSERSQETFGKELGVGGTLVALHRTQSGDFKVENAYDLEEFIASVKLLASTED